MTVLVWGSTDDPPVELVVGALAERNTDFALVDPHDVAGHRIRANVASDADLDVVVDVGSRHIAFSSLTGAYVRPLDARPAEVGTAPEPCADGTSGADPRGFYQTMLDATEALALQCRGRVLNRLSAMASNASKPYQAQVIVRHGFSTPDTLVTDDVAEVVAFLERHPDAIYKSASGIRSIVSSFGDADRAELERIVWCPVQFQERVPGFDVRVHVVGDRTFAARVTSDAVDYRYARQQTGVDAELTRFELSDDVHDRCVALADDLDLAFAGIDLKYGDDGRIVCFEVNPSPGFSYYELSTGLPIAAAVADHLVRRPSYARGGGRP